MKSFFRKAGACVRRTWVWTLLLVFCAGLLVWFVGPLLAVNDYKFWSTPTARLLSISILLLGWGLGMVFEWASRREPENQGGHQRPGCHSAPDQH